jgi:UDP-N-acetylmuramoyl-tripeptide--D-alanyl-D-alanine ligase
LWAEDAFLETLRGLASCPVKTFGFSSGADAQVVDYLPVSWNESTFSVQAGSESAGVSIPYAGRHFALNAASAILAALECGVSLQDACEAVGSVKLPAMRMEPVVVDGVTYVMDSYNAAPQSFAAALETLAELPTSGKRIVVAGEMKELGDMNEEGHRMVGRAIVKAKPDHVVFYGEAMIWAREEAIKGGLAESEMQMADSLQRVTMAVGTLASEGDTVLVKGSRAMELEKAIEPLLKREVEA